MRKAGDIVTALFSERFGPEFMEAARSKAGLFFSWEQVVAEVWPRKKPESGPPDIPAAAVHSRVRELEREVLLVEADHPGWIQILQTKQAELLEAVGRRYPDLGIRGIAFRLSREPFSFPAPDGNEVPEAPDSIVEDSAFRPPRSGANGAVRDEDFYSALKEFEKSVKVRNRSSLKGAKKHG